MNIQFFCPRWGSENIPWEDFLPTVKAAGYDGLEWGISNSTSDFELQKVFSLAGNLNMPVIAQHYETNASDFTQHYHEYSAWLQKIKPYPAFKINSQTGKDYFSFDQNRQLIEMANAHGSVYNQPVVHETHRGKFSFAAHITKSYLEQLPNLRLALDVSHWVAVAESYLDDQQEALWLAMQRTDHIHARVGYPEGPQVPDPRAAAWEQALDKHLSWWDIIVQGKSNLKQDLTITPEFGPFPYMVHAPATGEPLCDQWEVNKFIMDLLKKKYKDNILSYAVK